MSEDSDDLTRALSKAFCKSILPRSFSKSLKALAKSFSEAATSSNRKFFSISRAAVFCAPVKSKTASLAAYKAVPIATAAPSIGLIAIN